MTVSFEKAAQTIVEAGHKLNAIGLAPATSGNYSMRTENDEIAITVSGCHKGFLEPDNIMRVDRQGKALEDKKPSAETLLHCVLYDLYPDVNAILHTHSVPCTVLTRFHETAKEFNLEGYEMQKIYGTGTHDTVTRLPVYHNTQDMEDLSARVKRDFMKQPDAPAFLIRGHGLYAWGKDMDEALYVTEATEMMLKCELETLKLRSQYNESFDHLSRSGT